MGAVEDSSALLSLRNLRKLLTEQKSTMVALNLSRTSITPESLRTILQVCPNILCNFSLNVIFEWIQATSASLNCHLMNVMNLNSVPCKLS